MTADARGPRLVKALISGATKLKSMYESSREENAGLKSTVIALQAQLSKLRTEALDQELLHGKSTEDLTARISCLVTELEVSKAFCDKLSELQPHDLHTKLVEEKSRSFDLRKKLERSNFEHLSKCRESTEQSRVAEEAFKVKLGVLISRIDIMERDSVESAALNEKLVTAERREIELERSLSDNQHRVSSLEAALNDKASQVSELLLKLTKSDHEHAHAVTLLSSKKTALENECKVWETRINARTELNNAMMRRISDLEAEMVQLRSHCVEAERLRQQEVSRMQREAQEGSDRLKDELDNTRKQLETTVIVNGKLKEKFSRLKHVKHELKTKLTQNVSIFLKSLTHPTRVVPVCTTDETSPELIS